MPKHWICIILAAFFSVAAFLTMCNTLDYAIAQAWVRLLLSIFHQISFNNATLSNSGFLPFILLILLFINSYINIKIEKIKFTKLYLGCFKNPEQAIRYWLNFRFYFNLLSGFVFVEFSIKSFFSLCTIDFVSLFTNIISAADPDVYIGKFLAEAKLESIKKMSFALLFVTFTHLLIFVLNKKKELPFLQALLLVLVAGSLLLASYLKYLELTTLNLILFLTFSSIVACVICEVNAFVKGNLTIVLQKIKNFLYVKGPSEKKQYLVSFAVFLSNTYFINWCLLFQLIEKVSENSQFYNADAVVAFLTTFFWFYLSYRFLWFAANFDYLKSDIRIPIPLVPVIMYMVYIVPNFFILYSSWIEFSGTNFFYRLFATLVNPTKGMSKDIIYPTSATKKGFVVTIPSPAEGGISWIEKFVGLFSGIYREVKTHASEAEKAASRAEENRLNEADRANYESLAAYIKDFKKEATDPDAKAAAQSLLEKIWNLDNPRSTLEEKTALSKKIHHEFKIFLNSYCNSCPGSPGTGMLRVESGRECLERQLAEFRESKAKGIADILNNSKASTSTTPIEKANEIVTSVLEKTLN